MRRILCVSRTISVGLRLPEWGYEEHGHDVEVWACFEAAGRVDLEALRGALAGAAARFDHKPLWRVIGEGALIEDMLSEICRDLTARAGVPGARLLRVEAVFPGSRIIVECPPN